MTNKAICPDELSSSVNFMPSETITYETCQVDIVIKIQQNDQELQSQ